MKQQRLADNVDKIKRAESESKSIVVRKEMLNKFNDSMRNFGFIKNQAKRDFSTDIINRKK